jgi:hypothetical protein
MKISDRDLEVLSAYLDGELSGEAVDRLEARIQADRDLLDTFEQLQRTRTMLRSLPKMRAPRNYFITTEMVGAVRKPRLAFPVLRFASVLATFLLVLLFLGDFFVIPNLVMSPSRGVQIAEVTVEVADQTLLESEMIESQAPEAPVEEAPVEEPSVEEPMDKAMIEGEAPPAAAEAITGPLLESTPGLERLLATAVPAPAEEGFAAEMAEPEEEPNLYIESGEIFSPAEEELQPGVNLQTMVRIAEFVLVALALSTGLAAFILYRKYK